MIRRVRRQHQFAWMMAVLGVLLAVVAAYIAYRETPRTDDSATPIVLIKEVNLKWQTTEKLQVAVAGDVKRAQPQRMLLEVVLCDKAGNRIASAQSTLVDRSLGAVQVLDIVKTPQTFDRVFNFRLPHTIGEGYAAATFFDHANMLVAHQNSALWTKPGGE